MAGARWKDPATTHEMVKIFPRPDKMYIITLTQAQLDALNAAGITHVRYHVPDVHVPEDAVITAAVDWIAAQVADGRPVLVHCAKGRGRSATLLSAYLMRERGLSFDESRELLHFKRSLTKLEDRHRHRLDAWLAGQRATGSPPSPPLPPLPKDAGEGEIR